MWRLRPLWYVTSKHSLSIWVAGIHTKCNCPIQGWCKHTLDLSASTQAQRCALDKSNTPLSHLSQTKWPVYSALCYHCWAQRAEVLAQVNCQTSLLLPGEMWHWWLNRESDITLSSFIPVFTHPFSIYHSGSVTVKGISGNISHLTILSH